MQTILTAAALFDGTRVISEPLIAIDEGRVAAISARDSAASLPAGAQVRDFPGATLAPAFLDVHIHGAAGHDVMEATPEALDAMGRFLASRGTANYLATTVTAPLDVTLRSLQGLAKLIGRQRMGPRTGQRMPWLSRWAFILKGHFSRTSSAACIRRNICWSRASPRSTACLKRPKDACG